MTGAFCLDGDGAHYAHGALSTVGALKPTNYVHIVFNNGAHDSVAPAHCWREHRLLGDCQG